MSQKADSDERVESILNQLPADLLESARDVGVDVDAVVHDKLSKHGDYSVKTVARFVRTDIENQIEAEKADSLNGIIMGSRDRYGRNWPRRHSLVRSGGDHLQVSTWDGSLDGPQGGQVDIPIGGAIVEMASSYDEEYDSWQGKRLNSIKELDPSALVDNLSEVAVSPTFLSKEHEHETVVVKGTIAFVNPQTVFDGEDPDDWYDGEVIMTAESGEELPHFEVSLDTGGENYRVRGHFDRQAYARPYIQVPDLMKLCQDAARYRDSPENQAQFVQDGLRGEEVIMVGNVNSFNTNRNDDNEVVHYVDVGMTALVATDGTAQASLEESAQTEEPEPEPEAEVETEPRPDAEAEVVAEDDESEESDRVAEVRAQIEQYCEVTGTDMANLTLEDVRENMGGIDAPDVAIRQALKVDEDADQEEEEAEEEESGPEDVHGYEDLPFKPEDLTVPELREALEDVDDKETLVNLRAAEREGEDRKTAKEAIDNRAEEISEDVEDDFEPDVDAEDPWEAIEDEDGMFHCPGPDPDDDDVDCLASAGSTGELAAHIFDDHGASGDPVEWVRSQLEA